MDCSKVTGLEKDQNPVILSLMLYKEIEGGEGAVRPQTAISPC